VTDNPLLWFIPPFNFYQCSMKIKQDTSTRQHPSTSQTQLLLFLNLAQLFQLPRLALVSTYRAHFRRRGLHEKKQLLIFDQSIGDSAYELRETMNSGAWNTIMWRRNNAGGLAIPNMDQTQWRRSCGNRPTIEYSRHTEAMVSGGWIHGGRGANIQTADEPLA
jgi:hypothetical protein